MTIAIALMLVLAGCSGGTGAGGGTSTATSEADTTTMTEAQTEANTQTEVTTEESSLTEPKEATIVGIVDGDTYKVEFADGTTKTITTLGVNVPASSTDEVNPTDFGMEDTANAREHLAKYGTQLEKQLKENAVGMSITVVYDTDASKQTDADGNRLAYMYSEGNLLNVDLVANGFGVTTDTQHEKAEQLSSRENTANVNEEGIWSYSG